jgi:hypothetical protein
MRRIPTLLALTCWIVSPAYADLSVADPKELCALLEDYGIKTTEFAPPPPGEGERPSCYTPSRPTNSRDDGYEYFYGVGSHGEWDFVDGLGLRLQGRTEAILGQSSQAKFASMVERVLSALMGESDVREIFTAFNALTLGEQRHATVQGLSVSIQCLDYSVAGVGNTIELGLVVNNICNYPPYDEQGREQCICENRDLRWMELPE